MGNSIKYREFNRFKNTLMRRTRFGFDVQCKKFLNYLLNDSTDKTRILPFETKLFRTQRGHDEIEENDNFADLPYTADRMIPRPDKVKNGRVNSIGIPVLYLSDDVETAIGELRPWIHETISVGIFSTKQELKLLNLSEVERFTKIYLKDPTDASIIRKKVWHDVASAFSKPVSVDEQDSGYVATQMIGEFFKVNDFDGICYRSMLGSGLNFALFDRMCAELINGVVVRVKNIKIDFEQYGNNVVYKNNGSIRTYNVITGFQPIDDGIDS